ncbi:MAG: SNF2 helicase associated domain-containing protein [Verrucomicrobia subdivision 3 bacterium]|nr:SNF2 helicase associated domain-containing protein [Limisphaerales bacterium]
MKAAGWDVVKLARAYLAQGQVLSSYWAAPLLRGVVQSNGVSFRASMAIKSDIDVENLCTCREAREWGKICVHGVAVGLHWLHEQKPKAAEASKSTVGGASVPASRLVRSLAPPKKPSSLQRAAAGEPVELFIILPPNLDQAVARGKVMLVFEAKWGGGRCPLNALPKERAFAFSPQDNAIIEQIETLADGETPALLQLDAKTFAALLPTLTDHENITLGKTSAVTVTRTPLKLPLRATLETNGEIVLALKEKASGFVMIGDWVWQAPTLQPLGLPPTAKDMFQSPVRVPRSQVPQFLSQQWPPLQAAGGVEANFQLSDFTLEPQAPRFLLALRGGLTQLGALLQCAYGPRILTVGVTAADDGVWLPDPEVPTRYSTRDFRAEHAALGRLQRSGFSRPDSQGKLQLLGQNAVLNFLAREFAKLQREWSVTLDEQLENRTLKNIERVEPQFQITSSGVQWFDLGVVFAAGGGETFSPADIQRLILSGQSHTRLKNGKLAVIDTGAVEELQEVLLDCAPQQQAQGYRISSQQAGFLEATLQQHGDWKVQAPTAWRDRAAKQSGEAKLECPPLGDLEAVLRPYQKHGVAWLHFLRENGFGGILADEMGLGKTLQALAFLNALGRTKSRPHLIVCPTSLVFNWVAEAKKFTPGLKILALSGPDRHALFDQIVTRDIVVTSYALIRRDAERYRELEFDTVVLDEAQHIKNRQTQNAQAVKAIRAPHRIVLTGTPLENSVLDLWSIFDFLMPGYLGTAKDFRERYELPIAKEKSAAAQTRLARRLRPFMLRRLKKEVASDLPAKLEQVSFCELTPDQRSVYQQVIEASRKEVSAAVGAQGIAKSRLVVLTALLRLRQVCCDLRLLKLENVNPANASGKLELFGELLEEVIDGGHRLLVFSQFVGMLTLLKERLTAEGIEFCYLDGSTTDRAAVVERFLTNAAIPVFLISLKAGGVGLNLTGADTVIHFDPWWNPAVEDQATDRAHRIGQTRVVTSYKLITRDTVEEKILTLQNRKREIIQATMGGEEEFAAALNWEEIQELLA